MLAQLGHQTLQRGLAAQLGIDDPRIDHIVAMHRTGPRLEQWRGVDVADAQLREVGHQGGGVVQGEVFMKLQTLCRAQWL